MMSFAATFTEIVSGSTAAGVALGAAVGVLAKAWADNASGGRKVWFDQLQLALSTVEKLQSRADTQDVREQGLLSRIEALVVANTKLEMQKKYLLEKVRGNAMGVATAIAEFSTEEVGTPEESTPTPNYIEGPSR